jgi:hypothetical protein
MDRCPICGGDARGGAPIQVCGGCHASLNGMAVRATGEFLIPTSSALDAAAPELREPIAITACSWCGKRDDQVRKLLSSGAVAICDECVALCADILRAELGE